MMQVPGQEIPDAGRNTRSDAAILEDARAASIYKFWGLVTVGITLGTLIIWAVVSPLASAVAANGKITTSGFRKAVQHLEGGNVLEVLVREGDKVELDAVLMRLDDKRTQAEFSTLKSRLFTLTALETRLVAEESRAPTINFPSALVEGGELARSAIRDERELFLSRRRTFLERLNTLERRRERMNRQIAAFKGESEAAGRQLVLAKQESADYKRLYDQGYGLKNRLMALDQQVESVEARISRVGADRAEAEALFEQVQFETQQTIREYVELAAQRRVEVKQQIFEVQERLKVAEDALKRSTIRAPAAGTVFNLRKHAPGAVVAPNETLLEIVPPDFSPVAEVRIDPRDTERVRVGQLAYVIFPSLDQSHTVEVEGIVDMVSSDRVDEPTTGTSYYTAHIRVKESEMPRLGLTLRPGMPVEAHVVTGSRNAITYLLRPLIENIKLSLRLG